MMTKERYIELRLAGPKITVPEFEKLKRFAPTRLLINVAVQHVVYGRAHTGFTPLRG